MKSKSILIMFFVGMQFFGFAQNRHSLKMIHRVLPDRILLRWAPGDALAWQKANIYGYRIERYTVVKDGQLQMDQIKTVLTPQPLLPRPFNEWQPLIDTSNYAAVLAQAIHGTDFKINTGNENDVSKITTLTKERQMRYGFGLFSADRNFIAAQYGALGFVDSTVKQGEKYLYRIYSLIPDSILIMDSAGVFTGIDEFEPLPTNPSLTGNFGDKNVVLSWNYELLRNQYNSYLVERSIDGVNFQKLKSMPFVDLNKTKNKKSSLSYYLDSLEQNEKLYYYRIRGLNAFGETGPPSIVIKGMGITSIKENPVIINAEIEDEKTMSIEWLFKPEYENHILGFQLLASSKINGIYEPINSTPISSNQRKFIYKSKKVLEGSYYIKMSALPKTTQKPTVSFPLLVQTIDSVPPAPPHAVVARIDSNGIIKVRWKKNKEKDLLGYRLFRATHSYEEYSAVTSRTILDSAFIDTVQMNMLNDTVYYKLVAFDQRGNQSDFSKISFAIKPDIIPPAPAFFNNYEITEKGMVLYWANSNSYDVKINKLKRGDGYDTLKMKTLKEWTINDSLTTFTDESAISDKIYTYRIEVTDNSGLKANNEEPLTVKMFRNSSMIKPAVKNLDTYYDEKTQKVQVFWSYKDKELLEFWVYRAEGNNQLTLWKVLGSDVFMIEDPIIKHDTPYKYGVIAFFKNGGQTKMVTIERKF